MYTISKQFHFSASHQLIDLPSNEDGTEHKCTRLHGHSYRAEISLSKETLNEHSFVLDYALLAPFKAYIDKSLDHRDLNEVLGFQTTAENIAKHLHHVASDLFHGVCITVRVSETPATWASYTDEGA